MNPVICVSIGEIPFIECLRLVSAYPFVEIRLDLLNIAPEKIDILGFQCRQWIAACRPCNLAERERTTLLAAAIRAGATYVDIEYETAHDCRKLLIDLARQHHCRVIISYHNYDVTPETDTLNKIIEESKIMGADLVKIAVTANSPADCARVISLYGCHNNLLAFAMGETGKITRISAPFTGAVFTYASVDRGHQTAAGQMEVSEMEEIFNLLAQ